MTTDTPAPTKTPRDTEVPRLTEPSVPAEEASPDGNGLTIVLTVGAVLAAGLIAALAVVLVRRRG